MKLHRISLLFVAMLVVATAWAKALSKEEALTRALGNTSYAKGMVTKPVDYQLCYTANNAAGNLFYVFNSSDGQSYVVASADDLAPAILAYGTSSFDADDIPDGAKYWLSVYEAAISNAISTGTELKLASFSGTEITPMINDKWGQGTPFNNQCPLSGGQRCLTGCVATATGMLMHYWQHGNYSWNLLQMAYGAYMDDNGNVKQMTYTTSSANEVSKLLADIGAGINAEYGVDGTGAINSDALTYLFEKQGYDKGMWQASRDYFDDEAWQQLVYDELKAGRPVMYGGNSPKDGGHCFICDGYDGQGYFHFNWGWTGLRDGYYLMIGDNPLDPDKYGNGNGFVRYQTASVGLQPDKGNDYKCVMACPDKYILTSSSTSTTPITKATQTSTVYMQGGFYSYSLTTVDVNVGVKFENVVTGQVYFQKITQASLEPYYGYSKLGYKPESVMMHGTYTVKPIFCPAGKDEEVLANWEEMFVPADFVAPTLTFDNDAPNAKKKGDADCDGVVTMSDANLVVNYYLGNVTDAYISMTNADVDGDGNITMSDANGIVNLYLNPEEEEEDLSASLYNPIPFVTGLITGLTFGKDAVYVRRVMAPTTTINSMTDAALEDYLKGRSLELVSNFGAENPRSWSGLDANTGYTIAMLVYNTDMTKTQLVKLSITTQTANYQPTATPSVSYNSSTASVGYPYAVNVSMNAYCAGYYVMAYGSNIAQNQYPFVAYYGKEGIDAGTLTMETSTVYSYFKTNQLTLFTWPVKVSGLGGGMGAILGYYNGFSTSAKESGEFAPVANTDSNGFIEDYSLPKEMAKEIREAVRTAVFVPAE